MWIVGTPNKGQLIILKMGVREFPYLPFFYEAILQITTIWNGSLTIIVPN